MKAPHDVAQSKEIRTPEGETATQVEVQAALEGLSESDHAKLFLIAKAFCNNRKFTNSVLEPEELISEAIYRTLSLTKKWNKSVTFIRHLDRAMENISGHLAKERSRIVPFPSADENDANMTERGNARLPPSESEEEEKCEHLLNSVFADDKEARQVFVHNTEGFSPAEIQSVMKMSPQRYETVMRRVRRKVANFINTKTFPYEI